MIHTSVPLIRSNELEAGVLISGMFPVDVRMETAVFTKGVDKKRQRGRRFVQYMYLEGVSYRSYALIGASLSTSHICIRFAE